jgi:2-methylcitrate dehydratase PrpD
MVQAGMTGVADVFDGEPSFLSAYGAEPDAAAAFDDIGAEFEITATNIKRWSVGSPVQAVLDSLEALLSGHHFAASDVSAIAVHLPEGGARVVDSRDMPSVNGQHLTALMLVDGTVGFLSSHDASRMQDPHVLAMRSKVKLVPSAELSRAEPARQAIVEITLADGRRLRHHTRAVRGTTTNPMTRQEVETKALDLMSPVIGDERAKHLIDIVWHLEHQASLSPLASLLQGTGAVPSTKAYAERGR